MDLLGGNIVESVGKVADELITSDEEKMEKENERLKTETMFKAREKELDIKEQEIYLNDKDSARNMNIELSKSDSWLLKNTGSMLAWLIVIGTMAIDYLVAFEGLKQSVEDKEVLMFILGAMNTYTASIISFYFGSSKTEADKDKLR